MESMMKSFLSGFAFGDMLVFDSMSAIPLFSGHDTGPDYLTLDEALSKKLATITEISEAGSVPELKVTNSAEIPVLLLDGEELLGAKQNRILNVSILVKEKSETLIPVSCCEQGRWRHISRDLISSRDIAPVFLRGAKAEDVNASLRNQRGYRSDQARVWDTLQASSLRLNVDSPTGAMKDLFDAKDAELESYLQAFPTKEGQKGILVFMDGEAVGLDYVSRSSAYKTLHPKLIRSYAIESLGERKRTGKKPSVEKAKSFLSEVTLCAGERYPSVGRGWNYRYESSELVGAALVCQDTVIHASFFRKSRVTRDR